MQTKMDRILDRELMHQDDLVRALGLNGANKKMAQIMRQKAREENAEIKRFEHRAVAVKGGGDQERARRAKQQGLVIE